MMGNYEREIRENVYAIITAFHYNLDTKELIECLEWSLERLNGNAFGEHEYLAVDLIVSFIVVRYGDYGTSPRYGWFPTFERNIICDAIKERIDELKECVEMEENYD